MAPIPTLVSLLVLAFASVVLSSPCVTFDSDFNLLVFGLNGKDWNAGPQDTWTSGSAADITTTGRPPFDGANTTCYLAQFFNAVYILNGDAANPSAVHIYDAKAKSWTTQAVQAGTFDVASFNAILDHDTNVFYAVSHSSLFFLDMGSLNAANATALSWENAKDTPYDASYQPVMALAQNHIHFLNVPGAPVGDAEIFVIHFSYFQPEPQAYPLSDGSTFPNTHGQVTSLFKDTGVQQEFAFIPDDGSATYVINVETNTTQSLPGPSTKDAKAIYAAGITSLVQLDSTGALNFLPYTAGQASANAKAAWTKVANVLAVAPPGATSSGSSSASANSTKATASGSATKASAAGSSQTPGLGGAQAANSGSRSSPMSGIGVGMTLAGIFSFAACFL
ncbi:hypothetical protein NLI96_g9460 [Meripilus lineatus]|uniref:Uncharacterized protein n=1 Tax=Meripilus lineatus TaxID=2056292 RepID=A0AAD5YF70_9APHY|nr:hypothetical protein NLI96_g9460 [Physisporinus lineatus]